MACSSDTHMDSAKQLVEVSRSSADEARRQAQWQKQIDYGKNTLGYQHYLKLIPKEKRQRSDPKTPEPTEDVSKKRFDGQIRAWRRMLHKYDEIAQEALKSLQIKDTVKSNSVQTAADVAQQAPPSSSASGRKREHGNAFKEGGAQGSRAPRSLAHTRERGVPTDAGQARRQHKQRGSPVDRSKASKQADAVCKAAKVLDSPGVDVTADPSATADESAGREPNIFDMIMNEDDRWMEEDDIQL